MKKLWMVVAVILWVVSSSFIAMAQEAVTDKEQFVQNCDQLQIIIQAFNFEQYKTRLKKDTLKFILSIKTEALENLNKAKKIGPSEKGYDLLIEARNTAEDLLTIDGYLLEADAGRLAKINERTMRLFHNPNP